MGTGGITNRMAVAVLAGLLGLMCVGMLLTPPAGAVVVHAHRGGPNVEGVGTYPENSMSGFRHSLEQGWTIEFDLMRTQDGAAIVMHDSSLSRTTNCDGLVGDATVQNIVTACELDTIGISPATQALGVDDPRREQIPRLGDVLALLKETGGRANIEVKDLTNGFPQQVYTQIADSGVALRKIIIQNFARPYLDPVSTMLPGAGIALLTLNGSESYFSAVKQAKGNWVSPSWSDMTEVPRDQYVTDAHAQGLSVVPWTVDTESDLLAVKAAGADAVISNDPTMAERLIGTAPPSLADLRLKVKPATARVKAGRAKPFDLTVGNPGDDPLGPVRVTVSLAGAPVRVIGGKTRTLDPLAAGQSRKAKIRIQVRPKAKPGRTASLTFTSREAVPTTGLRARATARIVVTGPKRR